MKKQEEKLSLNKIQQEIIEGTLHYSLQDIIECGPEIAVSAFGTILKNMLSKEDESMLKKHNILGAVNEIRDILLHPYPQNRTENYPYFAPPDDASLVIYKADNGQPAIEKKGLLGLSGRNDNTAPPVTREAVISFILNIIQKELKLQKEKLPQTLGENACDESSEIPEFFLTQGQPSIKSQTPTVSTAQATLIENVSITRDTMPENQRRFLQQPLERQNALLSDLDDLHPSTLNLAGMLDWDCFREFNLQNTSSTPSRGTLPTSISEILSRLRPGTHSQASPVSENQDRNQETARIQSSSELYRASMPEMPRPGLVPRPDIPTPGIFSEPECVLQAAAARRASLSHRELMDLDLRGITISSHMNAPSQPTRTHRRDIYSRICSGSAHRDTFTGNFAVHRPARARYNPQAIPATRANILALIDQSGGFFTENGLKNLSDWVITNHMLNKPLCINALKDGLLDLSNFNNRSCTYISHLTQPAIFKMLGKGVIRKEHLMQIESADFLRYLTEPQVVHCLEGQIYTIESFMNLRKFEVYNLYRITKPYFVQALQEGIFSLDDLLKLDPDSLNSLNEIMVGALGEGLFKITDLIGTNHIFRSILVRQTCLDALREERISMEEILSLTPEEFVNQFGASPPRLNL